MASDDFHQNDAGELGDPHDDPPGQHALPNGGHVETEGYLSIAPTTIVTINGAKMVSGLYWQPLSRGRAYMKEARDVGRQMKMDIVAIRRIRASKSKSGVEVRQAGFVAKNQGVIKGMYSLATALAGVLGNSWIGVFALKNGQYALVGVYGGSIEPGCDVVADRADIEQRFSWLRQMREWDAIYVPADFQVGGESRDIYEILSRKKLKAEYRLKQLTFGLSGREIGLMVSIGALVVGSVYGYSWWQGKEAEKLRQQRIADQQEAQRKLKEMNERSRLELMAAALQHPWAKMSTVWDFAQSCITYEHALPLVLGGWTSESVKCEKDQVAATYRRQGVATVADFQAAVQANPVTAPAAAKVAFFEQGDGAAISFDMKMVYGGDDALVSATDAVATVMTHFQRMNIKVALRGKPYKPPPLPPTLPGQTPLKDVQLPVPSWKAFEFDVDTTLAPEIALGGLKGPGLRLIGLGVTASKNGGPMTWKIAGEIYGN